MIDVFNRLLASTPYEDYTHSLDKSVPVTDGKFPVREGFYRSNILNFLRGCGVVVLPEIHTNLGQTDLVVAHRGVYWVIEIKVAYKGNRPTKKVEEALRQIEDKNYAKLYTNTVCIGLAIDDSVRQITDWKKIGRP